MPTTLLVLVLVLVLTLMLTPPFRRAKRVIPRRLGPALDE
jgi:hypothetical protein